MTTIEIFLKNFHAILDETSEDQINAQTAFKQLEEWNSMTALLLIAMIDEKYGKKITGKEILASDTITDLFEVIK
jgi:acyl carrier protein